jgi:hypothetical protein
MIPSNLDGRRDNVLNGATRPPERYEIGLIRHVAQCTPGRLKRVVLSSFIRAKLLGDFASGRIGA